MIKHIYLMKLKTVVLIAGYILLAFLGYKLIASKISQQNALNRMLHNTALIDANPKKMDVLIEQGADVNSSAKINGETPLHKAVRVGNLPPRDSNNNLILPDKAIAEEKFKVVELLINNGADVNQTDTLGRTPLHNVSTKEIAELLITHGAKVDAQELSDEKVTPLFHATARHKSVAEVLINHGANVNQKSTSGDTPLILAVRGGNKELVDLLIERGADINYVASDGESALENAFQGQHQAIATLLMDKGASLTKQSSLGYYELHWAVKQNNLKMVQQILDKGKDVDSVDKGGRTPLMEAVINNDKEIAELLIKYGANVNFSSHNNWNGRPILFFVKDKEMMSLLLTHGANVKATDDNGRELSYFLNGRKELLELVINN